MHLVEALTEQVFDALVALRVSQYDPLWVVELEIADVYPRGAHLSAEWVLAYSSVGGQ